jgi:hypothetical protein
MTGADMVSSYIQDSALGSGGERPAPPPQRVDDSLRYAQEAIREGSIGIALPKMDFSGRPRAQQTALRPHFIVVERRFTAPPDDAWCLSIILPAASDRGEGGQWLDGPPIQPAIVPRRGRPRCWTSQGGMASWRADHGSIGPCLFRPCLPWTSSIVLCIPAVSPLDVWCICRSWTRHDVGTVPQ